MYYSDKMVIGKRKMNLAEALIFLENLEVFDGSDSESDIEINY